MLSQVPQRGGAYDCQTVILGGDITGKQLVPIVESGSGWEMSEGGMMRHLASEAERDEAAKRARAAGGYPAFFTTEERSRLAVDQPYREARFLEAILVVMRDWATSPSSAFARQASSASSISETMTIRRWQKRSGSRTGFTSAKMRSTSLVVSRF